MIPIDATIKKALRAASKHHVNASTLCYKMRIQRSQYNLYLEKNKKYTARGISDSTWERLYPWLEPFLPDDPRYYPRVKLIKLARQLQEKKKTNGWNCPLPS